MTHLPASEPIEPLSDELHDRIPRIRRRLRWVRWVAWIDLILLIALVTASRLDNRPLVSLLGPLHGGNFLLLVTLTATAAADGLWSWWFPVAVAFTGGPPGALIGEWWILRRLRRMQDQIQGQIQDQRQAPISTIRVPTDALSSERANEP